uniref:Uncharacterized protein n=1 Tax=Plectus sambesii TaxID=2011161 RepID=A0A914VQ50_9BILA
MQRGLQSFCSTPESADERRPGTQVPLSRTSSKRKFTGSCSQPVADALSTKRVLVGDDARDERAVGSKTRVFELSATRIRPSTVQRLAQHSTSQALLCST